MSNEFKVLIDNDIEILENKNIITSISIFNDRLDKFHISDNVTYTLKKIINGKLAKMSTENINNTSYILNELKKLAEVIDTKQDIEFSNESIVSDIILRKDTDYTLITNELLTLYDYKNIFPELNSIELSFEDVSKHIVLSNKNMRSEDMHRYFSIGYELTMKINDKVYNDYQTIILTDYNFETVQNKILSSINEIYKRNNTTLIDTKKYCVLFQNSAIHQIINRFTDMFDAKNMMYNMSVLSNKFNEEVFSNKISFIEDPTNSLYCGKRLFDNEGVKTYKKTVVDNGKFITKLYNKETAKLDDTTSTGNGYGVRNLYIKPGNNSYDNLFNSLNEGIVITQVAGTHSGINNKTGDISIQAKGYYKNDEEYKHLESIIISTNIFELLNNVNLIGNDLEFFNSSLGTPSIVVNNIHIVGK